MEDATEKRGSSVTALMDLVVRSSLAKREDVESFKRHTQDQYREIMNPENLSELDSLSQDLSLTLESYVPEAKVHLQWSELSEIDIPMPQAEVRLIEDEYGSRVERTAIRHGLQRAFIITMLQHLNAVTYIDSDQRHENTDENTSDVGISGHEIPNLILAIEEPELYQHPVRQRHLASVLFNLATGAIRGVAQHTQVIYGTHSPLFVGIDRFDKIRVLRKVPQLDGKPSTTELKIADLDAVATELWEATNQQGEKFTGASLQPRLQSIMTPWMSEGFFSDVVVLVEGEGDRAAIQGFAKAMNVDFDRLGISIIPCLGKPNIDRPMVIFRQLGIAVYVVWDGDFGNNDKAAQQNRFLLRLLGEPEQDWPSFISDASACFKVNLEETMQSEIGCEYFECLLAEAQGQFGIDARDHALKNPTVIGYIAQVASAKEKSSSSLESIVNRIAALRHLTGGRPNE